MATYRGVSPSVSVEPTLRATGGESGATAVAADCAAGAVVAPAGGLAAAGAAWACVGAAAGAGLLGDAGAAGAQAASSTRMTPSQGRALNAFIALSLWWGRQPPPWPRADGIAQATVAHARRAPRLMRWAARRYDRGSKSG